MASSTSLTVLCEAGGHMELQAVANLFKKTTGHAVNLIELPYQGLYNRIYSELSAGAVTFDIVAGDAIWIPTFANGLLPLDSFFTASVKADLFPATVKEAQYQGKFLRRSTVDERGDPLLPQGSLRERHRAKELQEQVRLRPAAPPTTWQNFTDVAEFFTRAPGLYGTDIKADVETEMACHVLQAGSPGVVLADNGSVIIDNAQHLAALEFFSGLNNRYHVGPPGAAETGWPQAQTLFYDGRTAMTKSGAICTGRSPSPPGFMGRWVLRPWLGGVQAWPGSQAPTTYRFLERLQTPILPRIFSSLPITTEPWALSLGWDWPHGYQRWQGFQNKPGFDAYKPMLATYFSRPPQRPAPVAHNGNRSSTRF